LEEKVNIEIILDHDRFIALSQNFPDCIGIGKTEKEAINELYDSVLSYIKKTLDHVVEFARNPEIIKVEQKKVPSDKWIMNRFISLDMRFGKETAEDLSSFMLNLPLNLN
jgi:hypothetical protein